jgi:hypothetical protein
LALISALPGERDTGVAGNRRHGRIFYGIDT